jgi:hypothetical protein
MKKNMNVLIIINAKKNAQFVLNVNAMKKIVSIIVIINQVILIIIIYALININARKIVV